MSITVQEVIETLQNFEDKNAPVLVWDDSCTYEIDCIDDTMDDRVDLNLPERSLPEPTFNEHQTYNMLFAIAAFKEGLEVWLVDPNEPDERLNNLNDIVDADGRLFVIKKGE